MDIKTALDLSKFASQQVELADEYAEVRSQAGQCESALEIMVSENLSEFRASKKNLGYEMSLLMLIEINEDARLIFKQYKELTAKYKGLEKKIEARQSIISYHQSVMRYQSSGEKYG
jgi:hypothetical protein